jgi:hypothetical protein
MSMIDIDQYLKNQDQFPPEELSRHAGKYIAWSPDGSRIIASDADPLKVVEAVKRSGHDPADCVIASVPEYDSIVLEVTP